MNIHHLERAAVLEVMQPLDRLLVLEWQNGNKERAVKHWIIAATQGHDCSIEALKLAYRGGVVEKTVLADALRAH